MRDCDFIPANRHESRSLKRAIHRRSALVVGLGVMMGIWTAAHQREVSTAEAMITDVRRQDEQLQIHAAKKASMEVEQAHLEEHEARVEQVSSPTQLGVILADLSRRLPETAVLTQMSVRAPSLSRFVANPSAAPVPDLRAPAGAAAPPATVAISTAQLTLAGIARTAADVINFAAALETSRLFDRVQIVSQGTTKWAGRRAERFELTCNLVEQKERR